jgi:hypothetical protein
MHESVSRPSAAPSVDPATVLGSAFQLLPPATRMVFQGGEGLGAGIFGARLPRKNRWSVRESVDGPG